MLINTLSFLAIGTPNGTPPFALLDDVSLQVPEPAATVFLAGMGALLAARLRRKRVA